MTNKFNFKNDTITITMTMEELEYILMAFDYSQEIPEYIKINLGLKKKIHDELTNIYVNN